ncbi:MAG: hypothetical protein LBB88_10345 [Planctomycetaceae bacterium]|nr:hypothetical protein [Planctomycetaceae bacterium]
MNGYKKEQFVPVQSIVMNKSQIFFTGQQGQISLKSRIRNSKDKTNFTLIYYN